VYGKPSQAKGGRSASVVGWLVVCIIVYSMTDEQTVTAKQTN